LPIILVQTLFAKQDKHLLTKQPTPTPKTKDNPIIAISPALFICHNH
jgi:hypothetical protein